jgi:hypothetical protein
MYFNESMSVSLRVLYDRLTHLSPTRMSSWHWETQVVSETADVIYKINACYFCDALAPEQVYMTKI